MKVSIRPFILSKEYFLRIWPKRFHLANIFAQSQRNANKTMQITGRISTSPSKIIENNFELLLSPAAEDVAFEIGRNTNPSSAPPVPKVVGG
ncbi:MAG: hypothetical protein IPN95_29435 [Bacteroidetes bacterium]|nr:hypothetical protein [Bacteroidota bacterium]